MATDVLQEDVGPGLTTISSKEIKSSKGKRVVTVLMNVFRNKVFQVLRENDELEAASGVVGIKRTLLAPLEEGSKEELGSCRNNVRFALHGPRVFIQDNLSGTKAAEELLSFLPHHKKREPQVISDKSLLDLQGTINSFCTFLRESLSDGADLTRFSCAVFRSYVEGETNASLWPDLSVSPNSSKYGEGGSTEFSPAASPHALIVKKRKGKQSDKTNVKAVKKQKVEED